MAQVYKKAVVILESYDTKTGQANFITCQDVFENFNAAYGEALLTLSEFANTSDEPGLMITPLYELEGETGFGIDLKNTEGKTEYSVFILFADLQEEDESQA